MKMQCTPEVLRIDAYNGTADAFLVIGGARCIKLTDARCALQMGQSYRYEDVNLYDYFCLSESMQDGIDSAADAMVMMFPLACVVSCGRRYLEPQPAQPQREGQVVLLCLPVHVGC